MTFEDIFQPSIAPIAGACITVVVGVNGLLIRWLTASFNGLRSEIKENGQSYTKWLINHEDKDQNRHEENLHRFEQISVALARMGSSNGTYKKPKGNNN